MQKLIAILVLGIFLLAGCAPTATPTPLSTESKKPIFLEFFAIN